MVSFLKRLFGGKEQIATAPIEQASKAAESSSAQVQNLQNLASSVMGGGIPNVAELQGAVDKLPESELSSVVSGALDSIPADARAQLGGLLSQLPGHGGAASAAGISSGDSAALGASLSALLKGEGGLSHLAGLFGGGSSGSTASGGSFDLDGLLSNPFAKTVLAALIPAILKAAQGK